MSKRSRSPKDVAASREEPMNTPRQKKLPVDPLAGFKGPHARTSNQKAAIIGFQHNSNLLMTGAAGTGKSYLAISLGLECIQAKQQKRISLFRSAVSTRPLGHLPGDVGEKMMEYERPYHDIINEILDGDEERVNSPYRQLVSRGLFKLESTSYLRGVSVHDSVFIIDEFQNMTEHEIYTVLTRVGNNCRVIISGDIKQSDLHGPNGFNRLVAALEAMKSFVVVDFTIDDVVRSDFAKQFMICWENNTPTEPRLLNETF